MLREIVIGRKMDGVYERRWYEDERLDLFVWFSPQGDIERFQITYDKPYAEKAIDWKRGRGLVPMLVDDGTDQGGRGGGILFLSVGGVFAKNRVIEYFRQHAANIDKRVSTFVLQTLQKFPEKSVIDRKNQFAIIGALVCGALIAWRLLR